MYNFDKEPMYTFDFIYSRITNLLEEYESMLDSYDQSVVKQAFSPQLKLFHEYSTRRAKRIAKHIPSPVNSAGKQNTTPIPTCDTTATHQTKPLKSTKDRLKRSTSDSLILRRTPRLNPASLPTSKSDNFPLSNIEHSYA